MTLCFPFFFFITASYGPCLSVTHAQVESPTGIETKRILILHSFEGNAPIFQITDKGLSGRLSSGGISSQNQFFESLDLRRNPGLEHRKMLVEQMRLRYGHRQFDMIITMFPESLEFVLEDCRDILPDAPILSLYLPQGFELPKTDRRIICHFPRPDIIGTFEIALKLVPGAKRVYLVSGAHDVDKMLEDQARRDLKKWEGQLEFNYLSHLPIGDISTVLSSAPPGSIALLLGVARDVSGKNQTTQEIAKRLGQISTAPIFGVLDVALGEGIVGGSLVSFEQIGARGGAQVLDILRGVSTPADLPHTLEVPFLPMFDWRQLHRWNLSVNDLPEGGTIINREYTLWDLKHYIIAALSFILAQSCLILMLWVQKRRRQSAEESLRQKTEELDRFFNVTLDLLCIANTGGYFLRLNPAWEKILGYSREELMAKSFFEFVHPDDLGKTREAVSRLASQMELIRFENRHRCKDGTYRFLEWAAVPFGELIYAAARDLTERMEVEAEARQRREELAHLARVATLGELTASLAHEVNQPLAAIMSNAQAAQRYLSAPVPDLAEIREILSDVAKEGSRASEVVNRLRTLLKKEKVEFEPLDLNSVFREVAALLNSDALMRNVKVSLNLDPQLPLVQGDRIQLQQVALNLMINSFDAMNECPGAERLAVITTFRQDSEVRAAVADSGKGVSKEESEKIFNPFFTTKPQGMGIGLSICRSIILRHQGKLWFESNPGQGAIFNFSLPAVPDEKLLKTGLANCLQKG
ncbi:MAG: ATP-binding protein [Desulfobacterales bacterium]|nr:ATP-binding protein [Desulfobacterales bacterium]